jgi:hypothetical protein
MDKYYCDNIIALKHITIILVNAEAVISKLRSFSIWVKCL